MAAESILDRLDRTPGGARRYVATLIVVGGASRAQVAEAMARKFNIPAPTGRSITQWKNNDPELRSLIQEMEAAKRDASPGDGPTIAEPLNLAQIDSDIFTMAVEYPAFGELMIREAKRSEQVVHSGGAFASPVLDDLEAEDETPNDDVAVLLAGHETDTEFEADARARLAADPLPPPYET